jgi:hypothetical protein
MEAIRHKLLDILVIDLCSIITRGEGFNEYGGSRTVSGSVVPAVSGTSERDTGRRHVPAGIWTNKPGGIDEKSANMVGRNKRKRGATGRDRR